MGTEVPGDTAARDTRDRRRALKRRGDIMLDVGRILLREGIVLI